MCEHIPVRGTATQCQYLTPFLLAGMSFATLLRTDILLLQERVHISPWHTPARTRQTASISPPLRPSKQQLTRVS